MLEHGLPVIAFDDGDTSKKNCLFLNNSQIRYSYSTTMNLHLSYLLSWKKEETFFRWSCPYYRRNVTNIELNPNKQKNPYQNPWPIWSHLLLAIWKISWLLLCYWTPKFLNPWRLLVLKLFGANISGIPFVHGSARIQIPCI